MWLPLGITESFSTAEPSLQIEAVIAFVEGSGEGGNRCVTRTEADGSAQVLADSFEGRPLNSPSDLAIDREAKIYFNDPCYGDHSHIGEIDDAGRAVEGAYRIDPDGSIERIIVHEVDPAEWHRSFP